MSVANLSSREGQVPCFIMAEQLLLEDQVRLTDIYNNRRFLIGRKEIYICSSGILVLFNICLLISDLIHLDLVHDPENTSQMLSLPVLGTQVVGFYCGVLGLVYSIIKNQNSRIYMAITALALNILTFILRLTFEIIFIHYRPEKYGAD